jgi:hypothetical protein
MVENLLMIKRLKKKNISNSEELKKSLTIVKQSRFLTGRHAESYAKFD